MTILKKEAQREGYKLIGASLPSRIHNYLTLYTLARGTTKTKIIKELLQAWIKSVRKSTTDDDLIKEIVAKANDRWQKEKNSKKSHKTFDQFCIDLQKELVARDMLDIYIKLVVAGLNK